jgi:hypothetical protein
MGLPDRSDELLSEPKLMTPVFGDRKLYDFIPAQKIENGSRFLRVNNDCQRG